MANAQSLKRHHRTCNSRDRVLIENTFQNQLEQQRLHYELQLRHQREQHATICAAYETELRVQREQLQQQHEKIEKLENQIFEIAKQPTTTSSSSYYQQNQTNQRTLTIINQLGAYEFNPQEIERQLDQNFTKEVFQGGPDKIAELAARVLLFDPVSQKPRVICTDVSRKTYRYIDPTTQTLETDPGFRKTHKLIRYPLGQVNLRMYCDHFQDDDEDDANRDRWKANDEFIEDQVKFPEKLYQFFKNIK